MAKPSSRKQEPVHALQDWVFWGALAWIGYGLTELILSTAAQMWRFEVVVPAWQWPWIALVIGVYAGIGAVAGIAGAMLLRPRNGRNVTESPQVFAALTIVLAFSMNLVIGSRIRGPEMASVAISLLLAAMLGLALWRGNVERILFFGESLVH